MATMMTRLRQVMMSLLASTVWGATSSVGAAEPVASSTSSVPVARKFVHPGIGFNLDDLEYFKANLRNEPWKTVYARFLADARSSTAYLAVPLANLTDSGASEARYRNDMTAFYLQAVLGYLTDNPAYSANATRIFDAWCTVHKTGLPFLKVGDHITLTLGSADLLRATYAGWTPAHTARCQDYVRKVLLSDSYVGVGTRGAGTQLRSANQGANQLNLLMSSAVFLDDAVLFDMTINAFMTDPSGGLRNSLPNGEIGDTGRDQGHAYAQLTHWSTVAETAWKQGIDLYSAADDRLLRAAEYWSSYNLGVDLDFIPFGPSYDLYATIGTDGRGVLRSPDWPNLLRRRYVFGKNLAAPATARYLAQLTTDTLQILYYRDKDDQSNARPSTRAIWQLPATSPLTAQADLLSKDVGRSGAAGRTEFAGDAWRLTTSTVDKEQGYRFAYKAMKGDGAFVARVASVHGEGSASAGLMVRTAVDASPSTPAIWLHTAEGVVGGQVFTRVFSNILSGSYRNFPAATPPYWFKLVRRGNFIYAYTSPDGQNWSNAENSRLADLPETLYIGLAAISGVASVQATAVFDNVGVGQAETELAAAPSGLMALATERGIRLDWTGSAKAVFYSVARAPSPDGPFVQVATEVVKTTFTDQNVVAGTPYYYKISSASDGGLTSNPVAVSAQTAIAR